MKDDRPVLAIGSVGGGLHPKIVGALLNRLAFNEPLPDALNNAAVLAPGYTLHKPVYRLAKGTVRDEIVDAARKLGIDIEVLEGRTAYAYAGSVAAIAIDTSTGEKTAAVSKDNPGLGFSAAQREFSTRAGGAH